MSWQQLAEQLFGPYWKKQTARLYGCNQRTVQRWANGQNRVPDDLIKALEQTHATWKT